MRESPYFHRSCGYALKWKSFRPTDRPLSAVSTASTVAPSGDGKVAVASAPTLSKAEAMLAKDTLDASYVILPYLLLGTVPPLLCCVTQYNIYFQ